MLISMTDLSPKQRARIGVTIGRHAAAKDPATDATEYIDAAYYILREEDIPAEQISQGVKPDLLRESYNHFAANPDLLEAEIAKHYPPHTVAS